MPEIEERLAVALRTLPQKPSDDAPQSSKKRYSEQVSQVVAVAIADELRSRGMREARPGGPGELTGSGAERRMAGGIGAKKVDVTWATPEAGLLFAISIKSINFRDRRTNNFQKNLINRRGDMLMEAVTLHRRFPFAVLAGLIFLDQEAENDQTGRRRSTFINAHSRLKLFTGRDDPAGRDEQYERLFVLLLAANPFQPSVRAFAVGDAVSEVSLRSIFDDLVRLVAERNPDFYEFADGRIRRASR